MKSVKKAPLVPKKYAGKWVAWNHEHTHIIASARTFAAARSAARTKGESDPLLDKVPSADVRFVGGAA